jgi:hypothetical protein
MGTWHILKILGIKNRALLEDENFSVPKFLLEVPNPELLEPHKLGTLGDALD